MVEVRKKNHRFYVGLRDEVGAYKLRNFANNMDWKEFSVWYAKEFPEAWERYQKQERSKAQKFKFELSLHNDQDAELIKQLNYSGDVNAVLKAALEAYLIPSDVREKKHRLQFEDVLKSKPKSK